MTTARRPTVPPRPVPLRASGHLRRESRYATTRRDTDHSRGRGRETRRARPRCSALTAVLYLWGLGASGYANDFYAAAVQAGTKSWKAFFFGSFDSSNFITVDKPPAVAVADGAVRTDLRLHLVVDARAAGDRGRARRSGCCTRRCGAGSAPAAGLLAGALLALTPVAVLMFRFNNPDALMTLLIVAAAYCVTRALEDASTKWLLLAGAAMGFSFLAKGLQPFTVLPALAIAYLVAAPTSLRRRLLQLLGAGVAIWSSAPAGGCSPST